MPSLSSQHVDNIDLLHDTKRGPYIIKAIHLDLSTLILTPTLIMVSTGMTIPAAVTAAASVEAITNLV